MPEFKGENVELSAKTLWPLFPLLLLVVVVCLTAALVVVVRRNMDRITIRIQAGALVCYGLAAVTAIASEGGGISSHVHRPFSILTQVLIVWGLVRSWRQQRRSLVALNAVAWSAILGDAALHYLLMR